MSKKSRAIKAFKSRKMWGALYSFESIVVFLQSLTAKDTGAYSGSAVQKFQTLVNNVGGRIAGINIFPNAPKFTQSINTDLGSYINNPWMKVAAGGFGYDIVGGIIQKFTGKNYFKHRGKVRAASTTALFSAILGTLFDPPNGQTQASTPVSYQSGTTVPQMSSVSR